MRARTFYLAVAILLGNGSGSRGEILYTITDLGTLGGTTSSASAINNNGTIVGSSATAAVDSKGKAINHAFLWSSGQIHDLGTPQGEVSSGAAAINDLGQIAGSSSNGTRSHAYRYDHGTFTDLGTLSGTNSSATGINASGQVVGYSETLQTNQYGVISHGFIFDQGPMTDVTPGSLNGIVHGINASGQMAIDTYFGDGEESLQSFLYQNGQFIHIANSFGAYAIDNAGQVTGTSSTTGHPFLFSGGVKTNLGGLGQATNPSAINNLGVIVGSAIVSSGAPVAFIEAGPSAVDLNTLVDPNSGWHLTVANGINDAGQIVGYGINSDGQTHGFLLNSVPEPTALFLIISSFPVMMLRRSSRQSRVRGRDYSSHS
ncbi:MAG TPA: DUF3466 family protein [Humisphaera sp.]|jgi:probable HAF family extracellular repeat protein|nr:DUF3466 family protein [Humisphaera sp.]